MSRDTVTNVTLHFGADRWGDPERLTFNEGDRTITITLADVQENKTYYDKSAGDSLRELAELISKRAGIGLQCVDQEGRGFSVTVWDDLSYVGPEDMVYIVTHPDRDSHYSAHFTKKEAFAGLSHAKQFERQSEADASYIDDIYINTWPVCDLDVPDFIRLQGRDAVARYVCGD